MAKDPYRGTPALVRVGIVGIVLVDVHVIVIAIAVQGVASFLMELSDLQSQPQPRRNFFKWPHSNLEV